MKVALKAFTLLKRNPNVSHEEFRSRLRAAYTASSQGGGGTLRSVRNVIEQAPKLPFPHDRFDGISEEWLIAGNSSPHTVDDRIANYVDASRSITVLAKEVVIADRGGGPVKFMSLLRRKEGIDTAEFGRYWAEEHARLVLSVPEVAKHFRRYVQNHCIPSTLRSLDSTKCETNVDGIVEIWFDSISSLEAAMTSARYVEAIRPDEEKFVALPNIRLLAQEE